MDFPSRLPFPSKLPFGVDPFRLGWETFVLTGLVLFLPLDSFIGFRSFVTWKNRALSPDIVRQDKEKGYAIVPEMIEV